MPVAVWGEGWGGFAPEWFDAVEAMTRKPDEIVIGLEDPDRAHVHIRDLGNIDMRVVTLESGGRSSMLARVIGLRRAVSMIDSSRMRSLRSTRLMRRAPN